MNVQKWYRTDFSVSDPDADRHAKDTDPDPAKWYRTDLTKTLLSSLYLADNIL